jgi:DUF4097 and DUF4098 domain-containing protein YvlB
MLRRIVSCFALVLLTSGLSFAEDQKTIHETYALNADGLVSIKNVNGDITIHGWQKNEVDMKAIKRGDADDFEEVEIVIHSTPERLTIETKYPKWRKDTDVSVEYELMLPQTATLEEVGNVNGGIDISSVDHTLEVQTVNGSAQIKDTKSELNAATVNGSITVNWAQFPKDGRISIQSVNGALEVYLPATANGKIDVSSVNGSIECDFPITVQGRFKHNKLSGTIGAGGLNIELTTVNGRIDISRSK